MYIISIRHFSIFLIMFGICSLAIGQPPNGPWVVSPQGIIGY